MFKFIAREFKLFVLLLSVCFFAAPSVFSVEVETRFELESRDLILILAKTQSEKGETIRLHSLQEKESGQFWCEQPARPLFSLIFREVNSPENSHYALSDQIWNTVQVQESSGTLRIRWTGFQAVEGAEKLCVDMEITADPNENGIAFSQSAQCNSDRISILSMRLGQFAFKDFGEETKLFLPYRSGVVYEDPRSQNLDWRRGYPGFDAPMPWFVLWREKTPPQGFRSEHNPGLYLGFHDPEGSRKQLACLAKKDDSQSRWDETIGFWAEIQAENMGIADNDLKIGGKAVLRTVKNDWFEGAKIYGDWVKKHANWYPRDRMDENGRTDSPMWLKEHCLWAMHRVNPEEMVPAMQKFQEAFGVPAAVHWYYWHKNPYDNDYPHFFPRDGFREAVAEMQKDGKIFIMPYINGLLWDSRDRGLEDWLFTREAVPGAVKNEDGSVLLHTYGSLESDGSPVQLAHMCPSTSVWKNKVRENALRVFNECGTQAVYIDQIAAAIPELCFDPTHGHPLGGGHWWNGGYRDMLQRIRADLLRPLEDSPFCPELQERLRKNPQALQDRAITTECTGETSLGIVDGFLTWHHQLKNQVPAFSAVYGGSIQMIGRDYRAGKTYAERTEPRMKTTNEPLACRMKSAEALCFGEQIGWFVPTIIEEADKFPFQKDVVKLRHRLRHYFYRGEMGQPPEFPVELPPVNADWNYYDSPLISAPAVRGGCWLIRKNGKVESAVLIFANTSEKPICSEIRIPPGILDAFSSDGVSQIRMIRYDPEGPETETDPKELLQPIPFAPQGVFAWELSAK